MHEHLCKVSPIQIGNFKGVHCVLGTKKVLYIKLKSFSPKSLIKSMLKNKKMKQDSNVIDVF